MSPTGSPTRNDIDSPLKFQKSNTKLMKSPARATASSAKKRGATGNGPVRNMNTLAVLQKTQSLKYEGQIRLNSPTSEQLKRSFLIKNHDASNFDQYYQQMKKRKAMGGSMMRGMDGMSPQIKRGQDEQIYHVKGKRPAARDGHTGIIFQDNLVVFGGDRHHMPFNDSYVFNLSNEVKSLGLGE